MPSKLAHNAFGPPVSQSNWGGRATRCEIDLDGLAANVKALATLARGSELMAVLKANAYGHGAQMTARTALTHGAKWLGVYTVDEGLALRVAGIDAPILVFGPFQPAEVRALIERKLTPTIASIDSAKILLAGAHGQRIRAHLKVDTGLRRAGVSPAELTPLLTWLRSHPNLEFEGLYTHFASADESDKSVTRLQLSEFERAVNAAHDAGFQRVLRHAANSAGILDVPVAHFDIVRAGISLYGYYPSEHVQRLAALSPVLTLYSVVSRLHLVPAGAGVGYGHEFRATRDSTIALVPIGYGDGLPRNLANGVGTVIIRGRAAPIVGRVSMDQITVDVTHIPGVQQGDTVTLIGAEGEVCQSAEDIACQARTISYDILTGIMPRVPRLYVRAGRLVATSTASAGLTNL